MASVRRTTPAGHHLIPVPARVSPPCWPPPLQRASLHRLSDAEVSADGTSLRVHIRAPSFVAELPQRRRARPKDTKPQVPTSPSATDERTWGRPTERVKGLRPTGVRRPVERV